MPQNKEVHKEYMRKRRQGSQNEGQGSQVIEVDTKKAAKLLLICRALDREVTGLDGKRVNLLSMVRYGVFGPTLKQVKESLEPIATA